jgi:hypothetical protein
MPMKPDNASERLCPTGEERLANSGSAIAKKRNMQTKTNCNRASRVCLGLVRSRDPSSFCVRFQEISVNPTAMISLSKSSELSISSDSSPYGSSVHSMSSVWGRYMMKSTNKTA